MSGKKPYHPNNWKMFKDAPDEAFQEHTFEEVMEWKVAADVACIIRTTNLTNQKTKEYIYKRQHAAEQKILKLMDEKKHEFVVCTHDALHYVGPDLIDNDD